MCLHRIGEFCAYHDKMKSACGRQEDQICVVDMATISLNMRKATQRQAQYEQTYIRLKGARCQVSVEMLEDQPTDEVSF